MKRIIHIAAVLLICVAFISCEREEDSRPIQSGGKPIRFTAECEWPEISRNSIDNFEDLASEGFHVWATWHKDPMDDSYLSNESRPVFRTEGTDVTYNETAGSGSESDQGNMWLCDYDGEWYRGYYNFAAVAPAGVFVGSQQSDFSKTGSGDAVTLRYINKLTVDFGLDGFHLGKTQKDLMYAFHNEDNSDNASTVVGLNFNHLFSLLTIKIMATSTNTLPRIARITIYGLHGALMDDLVMTQTTEITSGHQEATTITHNLDDVLAEAELTDEDNYYWTGTYDADAFNYGSVDVITPIRNLLVYPETLSDDCSLKIKVEYKEPGQAADTPDKVKTAIVNTGKWESGNSYVYTFLTD